MLQAKDKVKSLTEKLQNRDLESQPGLTMMESFESQVNQVLNTARDDAGKLAQNSLQDTNNVVRMVTAGSKGSFINISQVRCCPLVSFCSRCSCVRKKLCRCPILHAQLSVLVLRS